MNDVVAVQQGGALTAADIKGRVNLIQQVMKSVMKEGVHYDTIPGTDKPALLKNGAELLCMTFQIAPSYFVQDLSGPDEIRYAIACKGTHQQSGVVLGEGISECSSNEEKYKWKKAYNREFDATTEERRRVKYGYNKQKQQEYEIKQIRTEPADVANTVRKMGAKRGLVAMTLTVLAAGDMFHQDLEEMDPALRESITEGEKKREVKEPRAKVREKVIVPDGVKPADPAGAGTGAATPGTVNSVQANMIRKKLEKSGKDEPGFCAHFGIKTVEELPMTKVNDGLQFAEGA